MCAGARAYNACELISQRKTNKATNLRALFSILIEQRLLRWDSNPRPPAFKAVALPTEPPRQPSWLGSNTQFILSMPRCLAVAVGITNTFLIATT